MDAILLAFGFMGIKNVGKLPGICHSEAFFAAGEPSQGSGSKKALQVDYGIEFTTAKLANK